MIQLDSLLLSAAVAVHEPSHHEFEAHRFETVSPSEVLADPGWSAWSGTRFGASEYAAFEAPHTVSRPQHGSEKGDRHGGGRGHRGPFVPEPMVFDLVRSLGAGVGEAEVNTLVRRKGGVTSWAPEFEMVVWEGLALEFELPLEDERLDAYKFAAQQTVGLAWSERLIHGWQGILEHRRDSNVTELSLLHVGAVRFDDRLSTLWMIGGRGHLGGRYDDARTDALLNCTVFGDLSENVVMGLETNFAVPLGTGDPQTRVMPQVHLELSRQFQMQAGLGTVLRGSDARAEGAVRLIWSF